MVEGLLAKGCWLAAEALTPAQKYAAMRGMTDGTRLEFLRDTWFQVTGVSMAILLGVLLYAVRRYRLERQRRSVEEQFDEECYRRGLTAEEQEILHAIAVGSGLKRPASVFTMVKAFDQGAARLMQEHFSRGESIVERKRLNAAVKMIREKLGYQTQGSSYGTRRTRPGGMSSRTLPVGKTVSLAAAGRGGGTRINGVIVKNDAFELVVRPEVMVASAPGELWSVRYTFGSATWEFQALTMACSEEGLELSHSENIHFLNRRRFLRAAVKRPALVSPFPVIGSGFEEASMVPKFYKATVTEISGPGLRIRCEADVKERERVLVIFELEQGRLIQDIAEVRGIRETVVGRSIGVELIGLHDAAVNELVRVTNQIALQQGGGEAVAELREEEMLVAQGRDDG